VLFTSTSNYSDMDIYRVVLALLLLAYACYSDSRKRSVFNIVWLVIATIGIGFAGYYTVVRGTSFLIPVIFSTTITGAVSYIFFRLGFLGVVGAKATAYGCRIDDIMTESIRNLGIYESTESVPWA